MSNFVVVYNAFYDKKLSIGHTNAVFYTNNCFSGELFYEGEPCKTYFENWIKGLAYGITSLYPYLLKEPTQIDFIVGSENYGSSITNVVKFFSTCLELAEALRMISPSAVTDIQVETLIKKRLHFKEITYLPIRIAIIKQLLNIKHICGTRVGYSLEIRVAPYPPVNAAIVLMHEHLTPIKRREYVLE